MKKSIDNISFIETNPLKNEALALANDEKYYEKMYTFLVFQFAESFQEFYKNNKSILDSWINGNALKANNIMFLYELASSVVIENNKAIINYEVLNSFKKIKTESERKKISTELAEIINDIKIENPVSKDEFTHLWSFAQFIISFIMDFDFRTEAILFNLSELDKGKSINDLEPFYFEEFIEHNNMQSNFKPTLTVEV